MYPYKESDKGTDGTDQICRPSGHVSKTDRHSNSKSYKEGVKITNSKHPRYRQSGQGTSQTSKM